MVENKKDIAELKKLLKKCLSPLEKPMELEIEQAIIKKTHDIKGSHRIWRIGEDQNLTLNPFTIWKFCIIMHKILHYGHKQSLCDGLSYKKKLHSYGNYWHKLRDISTGQCIAFYCQLLVRKLEFHEEHKYFMGNMELEYEPELNVDGIFHMCLDYLDYLEDLLHMQRLIVANMESNCISFSSKKGRCRLLAMPLIASESYLLYQHSINALQLLDSTLCQSDISGLVDRLNRIVRELQQFYTLMQNHKLPMENYIKWPLEWSQSYVTIYNYFMADDQQLPQPSAPSLMDMEDI